MEAQVKQARVGLMRGDRGNALIRGRSNRQRLMAALFESDSKRFAEIAIIITQNKPHHHSPLPLNTSYVRFDPAYPGPAAQENSR